MSAQTLIRRALTLRNAFYALCAFGLWAYFDTVAKHPDAPNAGEIGGLLVLVLGFLCGRYYERHRRTFGDLPPVEREEREERERLVREYVKSGVQYAPKTNTTSEDDGR
jgi:hypothetical protein